MHPASIAIVGCSLGGLTAAERLRANGYSGNITLIGDEEGLPYDRPPLSKRSLSSSQGPVEVPLRSADEVTALRLDLQTGILAQRLVIGGDGDEHRVVLANGKEIAAPRVLIATGARARPLPFAEPRSGVFLLRTASDCASLRVALGAARRVVVIGAGFLGLEVASSARQLGLDVTVLEAGAAPLCSRLGDTIGRWAADLHHDHGVEIRCGASVVGYIGDSTLGGVALSDGEIIPADVAVVAVGCVPNTEWLEGSGVEVHEGVVCDTRGRTSVNGIFAIGDVARHRVGDALAPRSEHWSAAIAHAQLVAKNVLLAHHEMVPLDTVAYYWSDQYDAKLQVVGEWCPGLVETVVEGSIAAGRFGVIFRDEQGVSRAAAAVNMPRFVAEQRRVLQSAQGVEEMCS